MKDKTIYTLHSNICKALANPIRIEIIEILRDKELNFGEIQVITGALKSNLSQHLSMMVSNGILMQRKDGLYTYFKLSNEKIAFACSMMREVLIENITKQSKILELNSF